MSFKTAGKRFLSTVKETNGGEQAILFQAPKTDFTGVVGKALGMGALTVMAVQHVKQELNEKIAGVEQRLDEKIAGVEQRLDEKIAGVERRLDEKIAGEQNPPETLQSLLKYEYNPGQARRFLARVGKNFRWPSSMPEYLRRYSFLLIADVEFESDDEVGFNHIFYYNALDRGEFTGHENEWVTIHNQKSLMPLRTKPAKMVISQRANNGGDHKTRIRIRRPNENNLIASFSYEFYDTMNNNKKYTCVVDTGAPESILPYHVKRILGRRGAKTGWEN
ncbi:9774_t:CDS:2 [Paraglomus occultum]|uniref:9774_t:CDS:1 n=1 Tax=Paraglomus occultum TaxID=144539 RepID=A0A9N9C0F1_9GLOM|nr:9774_t:CDS:2 [Paraglomus occultum]